MIETIDSLAQWAPEHVHASDIDRVVDMMIRYVMDYPEVTEHHGWSTIRELAERCYGQA